MLVLCGEGFEQGKARAAARPSRCRCRPCCRRSATRSGLCAAVSAPECVERRWVARHREHLPQRIALEAEDEGLRDVELAPVAAAYRAIKGDDELIAAPDVDNLRPVGAAGQLGRASKELEDLGPAVVLAGHGAPPRHAPDDSVANETADGDRIALGEGPERVADAGDVVHAHRFPRMRRTGGEHVACCLAWRRAWLPTGYRLCPAVSGEVTRSRPFRPFVASCPALSRAVAILQAGGHRFDPGTLHEEKPSVSRALLVRLMARAPGWRGWGTTGELTPPRSRTRAAVLGRPCARA